MDEYILDRDYECYCDDAENNIDSLKTALLIRTDSDWPTRYEAQIKNFTASVMMDKTEVFLPSIDGSYEEPFLVLEQIDYNKFLFMCNGTINSLALLYYQTDIDYCNLSFDIYMENNIVINEITYPSSNEMLGLEEAKCASKYDSECSHIKITNIIINQDTFNNFFNTTDKYGYFDTKYTLCCGKYS